MANTMVMAPQTLNWYGETYRSVEHCTLFRSEEALRVSSTVAGDFGNGLRKVEYAIELRKDWSPSRFAVKSLFFSGAVSVLEFERDGEGLWWRSGRPADQFDGCTDVDISLTPFTNSLPLNRLQLAVGATALLRVVYVDVLNGEVRPLAQRYTRLSAREYRYENVPKDFEAVLLFDEDGFVVSYAGLFARRPTG